MKRTIPLAVLALGACAASPAPTRAPALAPAPAPAPAPAQASCDAPENRQLDFWIGDWDVVIRARQSPNSDQWKETRGSNRVRAVLGGCVIEEDFSGDPTGVPWRGKSHSTYVAALRTWRQTWVDDSDGYIALRGGKEGDAFVLYGEPRAMGDETIQMRMVYEEITPRSFTWSWERGAPGASPVAWTPMMVITYARRAVAPGPCAVDPSFHDLDFWLGDWKVSTADGKPAGTNRIEKILDGCAVTETWRDIDGNEGRSLFFHPPGMSAWKQVWVTAHAKSVGGAKEKDLVARGDDGSLMFRGELPLLSGGTILDRTTLTPLPGGKVRQRIETSRDRGASWTTTFDAVYER